MMNGSQTERNNENSATPFQHPTHAIPEGLANEDKFAGADEVVHFSDNQKEISVRSSKKQVIM